MPHTGFFWRMSAIAPLVATTLITAAPATPTLALTNSGPCQFLTPTGGPSAIHHVVHVQFDNVHFTRDNPNVPSDLEQMPHLLNFIEGNGTLLANEHTPLIAHTANDFVTGLTGVYGDQHGIPVSNSFEYYNNSSVGAFNTSAFIYWTDTVQQDPANAARKMPLQMIDAAGKNLPAPWVPFVNNGCNFGAVSTANMVLENNTSDIAQVFGSNSPEANDPNSFNDFVGIAVHCADATCSTVGSGASGNSKPELGSPPQGKAALYGHTNVASQVSPITMIDGTPITGFSQANGFNPTANYTLGYLVSLLQEGVPVVYGEIADAHDSGKSCAPTTAASPTVSPAVTPASPIDSSVCGAFAPGEPGYVAKLKSFDDAFAGFFDKLKAMGVDKSNTVFVFHSDENDHYAGSAPTNPGCDGLHTACIYDRTRLGEVTSDLPLLLKQQQLYNFGMFGGTGSTPGTPRSGFTNADDPYAIDFDTAPGFWLKGPSQDVRANAAVLRKLEGALSNVTSPNPYTDNPAERLFRFFVDAPGLKALHMVTADPNRTPGVVGFGAEDHFIQTTPLIGGAPSFNSVCNHFPSTTDGKTTNDATCTSNGFIWLHGNFAADVNNTWAGIVGPGVLHKGVDHGTWADHTDLRPTIMQLTCLRDDYTYEGRALLEDLQGSAVPLSARPERGDLIELGRVFKQINAPVGTFGKQAIQVSTRAIRSTNEATYNNLEGDLQSLVTRRDDVAGRIESLFASNLACGGSGAGDDERADDGGKIGQLKEDAGETLQLMTALARSGQSSDPS